MRYQSALVLSTFAVGQAAAASNLRHASFHKRHEAKRDGANVDWDSLTYDLTSVDWSKVDYGNGAPPPASTPAASQPEVVASPAPAPSPSQAAPKAQAQAQSSSDSAPATESSSSSSSSGGSGDGITEVIGDILGGIEGFASKLGAQLGDNSQTNNGQVWIGGDGQHTMTFNNAADKDAMVWCWGKPTMWINANKPVISVNVKAGESVKLSAADGFSGGCGASFPDSDLFMGLLNESILEFTFGTGAMGCFDISREINMRGIKLTAKGKKCTSGADGDGMACTFICTDPSSQRCGDGGGDYDIDVGSSTSGDGGVCMVGKDPITQDASGGCIMSDDGSEHIDVTIHGDRW